MIIQEEENDQVLMIDVLVKGCHVITVHEFILKGWLTVTEPQIMP
jgi:hypothetical protein